jgi:hypothetical protein
MRTIWILIFALSSTATHACPYEEAGGTGVLQMFERGIVVKTDEGTEVCESARARAGVPFVRCGTAEVPFAHIDFEDDLGTLVAFRGRVWLPACKDT